MPTSKSIVAEIISKRTLNSKHYLLSDGSYQAVISMGQIHFDDGEGNLHNINTDLFDEADLDSFEGPVNKHGKSNFHAMKDKAKADKMANKLNRDNFDYQGLQVPFEVKIPRNIKRGYTIGKGPDKLTFKPVGASPAKGYVDEDASNRIHYQDAWNDADVILELTDRGIKETIILKTDRAPSSFSFEVDGDIADDLTAGGLKLQAAWLEDANGTRKDVTQSVRRENNKVYVDMVADVSGLVYPIVIDPTVTIQPDETASKDTYVDGYSPTSNYGTSDRGSIGYTAGSPSFFLIQFDLSSIPDGSAITLANASIYQASGTNPSPIYILAYPITSPWDEATVNYNSAPSYNTSAGSNKVYINSVAIWRDFDITSVSNQWLNGSLANNGIVIRDDGGSHGTNDRSLFWLSNYSTTSLRPKLTVTYNEPPTAPTVTVPNGGESWNSQETVTWEAASDPLDLERVQTITNNGPANFATVQGQPMNVDKDKYIYKVSMFVTADVVGRQVTISLRDTVMQTGSPRAGNTTYASNQYTFTTTSPEEVMLILETPIKFPIGTILAIDVESPVNLRSNGVTTSTILYPYHEYYADSGRTSYTIGSTPYANASIYYMDSTRVEDLQYQIQLSTDDGTNWKDIVALTSAGVTSYPYDFINETESSTCLIRIRAYDGSSYGPWDVSDGVFTIVHNQAPTAPTNLSPSGGVSNDRASSIRFAWQHNDPNSNDPQSQFDLQWRVKGITTWNTVSQSTTNQYLDMPAGTLPHGNIEWQVRTYDQAGLSSPYSALATFLAGDKPSVPTLTAPLDGDTVAVANPTVQWSSSGQTGFTLSVKDATATEVYSATGTTNKAHTVQYDLANQSTYTIDIAISNTDNLSSDPDSAGITVSYTPPADPILSTQIDSVRGSITMHIENPVPSGTEPNVSYNDVYRRKLGDSDFIRVAVNIPNDGSYTDYTPASAQVYEYYVRVYGDNGTFNDSAIISDSVAVSDAQLALTTDYSQWAGVVLNDQSGGPKRDFKHSVDRSIMVFAGREYPVAEYSEFDDLSVGLSFIVQTKADIDMLRKLAYSRQTLLYRDSRGRREFVTLDGLDESDLPFRDDWYSVSVNPLRVSYEEEV